MISNLEDERSMRSDFLPHLSSAILEFDSIEELRHFGKQLLDRYQEQVDRYGEMLATSMRIQQEEAEREGKSKNKKEKGRKVVPKRWQRIGSILINTTDPTLGMSETVVEILEEMRFKVRKLSEALRSF